MIMKKISKVVKSALTVISRVFSKELIQHIPFGFIERYSNAKIGLLEYFLFPASRVRPSESQ
jgi:hypothetical protein